MTPLLACGAWWIVPLCAGAGLWIFITAYVLGRAAGR